MTTTGRKTKRGMILAAAVAFTMLMAGAFIVVNIDDADAANALPTANGEGKIVLTEDVIINSTTTVDVAVNEIDLKGHTITIEGGANVTFNSGVKIHNGIINTTGNGYGLQFVSGTFEIKGVEFSGEGVYAFTISNGVNATFNECKFVGEKSMYVCNGATVVFDEKCTFDDSYLSAETFSTASVTFKSKMLPVLNICGGAATIGTGATTIIVPAEAETKQVMFWDSTLEVKTGKLIIGEVVTGPGCAGSIAVNEGASVQAEESTVTISGQGSIDVGTRIATTFAQAKQMFDAGLTEVTMKSSSPVDLDADFTIGNGKTLNIINTTVKTTDNKIIVNGSLAIDNSYIYAGVDIKDDGDFTAKNTHKLSSTGTLNSDTYVGFGDELTLSGIVPAGINVHAFGKLIIEDLTVNGEVDAYIGSDVQINGKVTVANKFKMNDAALNLTGTIEIKNDKNGGASFELAGASELTVAKEGSFRVLKGTANTAAVNTLLINENAKFIVEGTLDVTGTLSGTVQDKGTINFNGTSDNATVVLYDGIEFSPVSVTGSMTVSVKGIVEDIKEDVPATQIDDGKKIVLKDVKGVKIVSSVDIKSDKAKKDYYLCNLDVSGTITTVKKDVEAKVTTDATDDGVSIDPTSGTANNTFASIKVSDSMTLGEGATLTVNGGLTVDGTVTAVNKHASIVNNGKITVNGLISVKIGSSYASITGSDEINAVKYTITDAEGVPTEYYSGFAGAIENIANADEKTVTVQNNVTASKDAEIPADATIAVEGTLKIKAGATITVADGAVMNVTGTVKVDGTLVITNTDTGLSIGTLEYQVYTENGKTATYTSLANALKNAKEGDVITLSGNVEFSSDAEIPAGVTVNVGKNTITLKKDVTLIVNGTLNIAKNSGLVVTNAKDIVANGVVSYYDSVSAALTGLKIEGAYFTLKGVKYITNVAYAAENCKEGDITIRYNVTAGDVTFTAGKNGLTITTVTTPETNQLFRAGTITLDGATLVVDGKMTGTVAAKADGSTATIALTNAEDITISSEKVDDADFMFITSNADTTGASPVYSEIGGKVEIKAGTVTSKATMNTTDVKTDSIIVASGATLVIAKDTSLNVADNDSTRLVVDGTLQVVGSLAIDGKAVVNGTMTVQNANVTVTGELSILGTLEMKDKTSDDVADGKIKVKGVLSVGTKTTSLGASATVIGAIDATTGYVKAYPGSDMTKAKINWNTDMDASDAKSLDFIVNGAKYMTVYTCSDSQSISTILEAEVFEIAGVENDGLKDVANWYTSEEMKDSQKVEDSATVSGLASADVSAIYAYAAAAKVQGTITQGTGLELFIDGKNYDQFADGKLTVGTHTIMMNVKTGYDGSNASVTFNGVAVTDGKIVITAEMTSFTLVASGATPASSQIVVDNGDKDDGMGLTDILLIVLVVLIAVMAIMVALRMMRS